jgi:hypothetical protein
MTVLGLGFDVFFLIYTILFRVDDQSIRIAVRLARWNIA